MAQSHKVTFLTRCSKYAFLSQIKNDGRLRFAPLSSYRENDLRNDRERFDEFEGATRIDQPRSVKRLTFTFRDPKTGVPLAGPIDHQLVGPIKHFDSKGFTHILCFSIHEQVLILGENVIDLTSEGEGFGPSVLLIHDIAAFVRHIGEFMDAQNIQFECRPVEYVSSDFEGPYSVFKKPERLKHQREYRLAIRADSTCPVEFTVPRLEETLEVFTGLKIKLNIDQAGI
ncbi:hypothetical protein [Agrobacterium tumefaciens]|uniref:hypothetical protein n=1 Tax=Agrobacterium tumefaciens TaxID=358 RepID=UPI000976923E|nr:hypothetical protein BV900_10910 [Agrobacterium tumefaciens]